MIDPFATLLRHFEPKLRVFFAGSLCTRAHIGAESGKGHLHLLRRGSLEVIASDGTRLRLAEPSLLFLPRPTTHSLDADGPGETADLVCAEVDFGAQLGNPLLSALPALMHVALKDLPALHAVLEALFTEAFAHEPGREAAVDRLGEVVLLHLLRHALKQRWLQGGVLAALADARLSKALQAMHEQPAQRWTLQRLAGVAGMSRARFAAHFAEVVGIPPAQYLTLWRMSLAQGLLGRGRALKAVAAEVGYGSTKALSRAFSERAGLSPTQWQARQARQAPACRSAAADP